MRRLKIGVIGTGHMGINHVRNLSDEKRFELIGVFDSNSKQAASVAEMYGTKSYESLERLLEDVEAVVVAVPSSLHKEIGLKVAEKGVHALIEKPLATCSADAHILRDVFESAGLKLQVGHVERFNAVIQEIKKIVQGKEIFYIEAHRYSAFSGSGRISDVSVIEDLMIHDIDLVCDLMSPNKVIDIRGNGECIRSNYPDFATCMLGFSSNAHAVINASRISQDKERSLQIHAADCTITADLLMKTLTITQNTEILVDSGNTAQYRQDAIVQKVYVPIVEPLRAEQKSFFEAVVNNGKILVDGDVAIKAIEICEKVSERVNACGIK